MYPRVDPYQDHCHLVKAAASAGATPPSEWTALKERFDALSAPAQFPIKKRLTDAILDGHDADIAMLKALTFAEQIGATGGQAIGEIQTAVVARLKALYSEVAAANYDTIANKFDSAAKKFTELAAIADPEADAVSMIDKSNKVRKAFLDAESFGNELTKLVPALCAAMTLASGVDVFPSDHLCVLPLICDPSGHKRADVWKAYEVSGGRCGKWAAMVAAGIKIKASPVVGFGPYRRPTPGDDAPIEPFDHLRRPSGRGVFT
jgi:hypothetical protein